MEAFSLLKYWKGAGGGSLVNGNGDGDGGNVPIAAVSSRAVDSDEDDGDGDGEDDGPFFDLEFAVPEEEESEEKLEGESAGEENAEEREVEVEEVENDVVEERELIKFTVSGSSSLSPSDDLFIKGRLLPIDGSDSLNSKSQFQSLLRSATKLRVFMLGLKRSKSESKLLQQKQKIKNQNQNQNQESHEQQQKQKQSNQTKLFTVKLNIEEVPIVSLFTKDNRSRSSNSGKQQQQQQQQKTHNITADEATPAVTADEKRNKKETVQKYLKMVKPLYIRVSKRHSENPAAKTASLSSASTKSTEEDSAEEAAVMASCVRGGQRQGSLSGGLRVMAKHLGKSKSASASAAVASTAVDPAAVTVAARRRDDSLLQQQDGIQGAILHCKRSFHASPEEGEASTGLSRSASDPSTEKSRNAPLEKPTDIVTT